VYFLIAAAALVEDAVAEQLRTLHEAEVKTSGERLRT
jgi:hypothetical protein